MPAGVGDILQHRIKQPSRLFVIKEYGIFIDRVILRDLPEVKEARRAQVDHLCDLHRLRACMVDPRHVVGEHPAGHLLPLSDFGHLKGSRLRKRVTVNHFTTKSRLRPVHRHIAVERKAVQIVHHQPCPST